MSGHNKWSKIKHKKAATDAKKSKEFSKYAKLIAIESKNAGGNIESPGLKTVIDQAKAVNMPKVNIEKAVQKGVSKDAENMEAVTYESYGPGSSALIISGLTENRNKASAEIKHILTKNGLVLAEPGAASWAFEKKDGEWEAVTKIPLSDQDKERLTKLIEELEECEEVDTVYTNAE